VNGTEKCQKPDGEVGVFLRSPKYAVPRNMYDKGRGLAILQNSTSQKYPIPLTMYHQRSSLSIIQIVLFCNLKCFAFLGAVVEGLQPQVGPNDGGEIFGSVFFRFISNF